MKLAKLMTGQKTFLKLSSCSFIHLITSYGDFVICQVLFWSLVNQNCFQIEKDSAFCRVQARSRGLIPCTSHFSFWVRFSILTWNEGNSQIHCLPRCPCPRQLHWPKAPFPVSVVGPAPTSVGEDCVTIPHMTLMGSEHFTYFNWGQGKTSDSCFQALKI